MLRIYPVILEVIASLRPSIAMLERKDPDLARQLKRASASVALNVAEGMYSRGKNRAARYHTALGSMRDAQSCLEVAIALGYVGAIEPGILLVLNQVIGTLVRLTGADTHG